jgi:hypothetical protein
VVRNLEAAPASRSVAAAHLAAAVVHAGRVAGGAWGVIEPVSVGSAARFEIDELVVSESGSGIEAENAALDRALIEVRTRLAERARTAGGAVHGILEAHLN